MKPMHSEGTCFCSNCLRSSKSFTKSSWRNDSATMNSELYSSLIGSLNGVFRNLCSFAIAQAFLVTSGPKLVSILHPPNPNTALAMIKSASCDGHNETLDRTRGRKTDKIENNLQKHQVTRRPLQGLVSHLSRSLVLELRHLAAAHCACRVNQRRLLEFDKCCCFFLDIVRTY